MSINFMWFQFGSKLLQRSDSAPQTCVNFNMAVHSMR